VDWPDRYLEQVGSSLGPRDAVCVLTHDTKFDVPAILGALSTGVGYIGAMGSRRTHAQRWERLLEAGADEGELRARLMSPIGLDVGARTPEESGCRSAPRSSPCAAVERSARWRRCVTERADPLDRGDAIAADSWPVSVGSQGGALTWNCSLGLHRCPSPQ